ncbi:hypothetical protein Vretimale_19277 [Volvox reticuliferus]|uniref:PB1 domain-containing protein n=1 Tax=Volvox reticuliferus TaxID=1737510 RepID=A0A8J4FWR6_9CHLO|nr:hypothetical protein Vretifemale_17588 [Volvox reticuliferus]GIM16662.1 hypothetical protein Vretimale_19277 [Volvox reticuliferus]
MTKVECPGPGFKGLKWKWIQDHAKEQQERDKERLAVQEVQLPGSAAPAPCPQQHAYPNNSAELLPTAEPCVQRESMDRQSGGGWELTQPAARNAMPSPAGVKAETVDGLSGVAPAPAAPWAAGVHVLPPEERARFKDEQEGKAVRWACEGLACPALPASGVAAFDLGNAAVLDVAKLATGTAGASACTFGAASGAAVAASLAGSGISPSPAMPATGVMGCRSVDVASIPAAPVVFSPPGVASPPAPATSATEVTHQAGTATATTQTVMYSSAVAVPACSLTPPTVPAVAPQPALTHPPGAGPSSGPALAAGAQRVRLPPAKVPSITVSTVAIKGGDDFESMFTPLSSLPVVKSETPKTGIMSRAGSLLSGLPASLPGAAAGGAAAAGAAAAVTAAHDAGAYPPGGERRAPLRKASRLQDARTNAGQSAGAAGPEQAEADHAPTVRSRTPVTQISAAAGSVPGAETAKEALVGTATTCATTAVTGGKTPQQSQPLQLQGQCQAAAPPQHQQHQLATTQQQRAGGAKHGKDGVRMQDNGEGLTPPPGAVAAAAGVGATMFFGARATGAERPAAPVSAGSTPAAAPAHSGGEAGERKRPRSEGSKPKAGTSLTGEGHGYAENLWPYGICTETLADRVKRAKRAATSSSDQDGPYSHCGSAERLAAHMGHFAASGDLQANIASGARVTRGDAEEQPPRPAVSAEAQSRGIEPVAAGKSSHWGLQAPTGLGGGVGGGGTAGCAGGKGGVGAKQPQQQRQQGREKSVGRAEDAPPASVVPRNGAVAPERLLELPASNNNLRMSGGGAVTDSSGAGGGGGGGGGGHVGSHRASAVSTGCKATGGGGGGGSMLTPSGTAAGAGTRRTAADVPLSSRRQIPVAKMLRSDPHLPRPSQPHGQDRRSAGHGETAAAAATGGSGRAGGPALPPPPSSKPMHRASCGMRLVVQGPADGPGPLTNGTVPGHAPPPALPSPSTARHGRPGETDMPAAGSCKGPVVAGSRGSKDGAGDKGACGPRHGINAIDAACGGTGGATGCGGAGAAATTTTEPKTDSDTRTSRVVECFFEFDLACRVPGTSASISGLGSTGSLQGGHSLAARLGNGRFIGATAAVAPLLRGGGGGGGVNGTAATAAPPQLLDLGKIRSFKELWTQLASLYDGTLPDEMDLKIIYLDEEGDWIMVTPDEPWSSVAAAATKVLVTNRT